MIRASRITFAVLTAALALPASAAADATVSLPPTTGSQAVLVEDTSSEANRLDVDVDATTITIRELRAGGIALDPAAEYACDKASATVVTCLHQGETYGLNYLELKLGPGDDETLEGAGTMHRRVVGGPGDDIVRGGAGYDRLEGGADDDELVPAAGDDELYGGDGIDLVDYSAESRRVVATLPQTGSGPLTRVGPNEEDTIDDDIEDLTGGTGEDDLYGNDADNILDGGPGNDDVSGSVGEDLVIGGPGYDALWAGGDDDHIDADDDEQDETIWCSAGEDTADIDNDLDATSDCETVAPELGEQPRIRSADMIAGRSIQAHFIRATGIPSYSLTYTFWRCAGDACEVGKSGPDDVYDLREPDVGRTIVLTVTVANAAGVDEDTSEPTPAVTAPRQHDLGPSLWRPEPKTEPEVADRFAQLATAIDASLRALTPHADRFNARRLARRKTVKFLYSVPTYGVVSLRWTVSARTARRYGVRAKGSKPVIIARGSGTGRASTPAVIRLKATKAGRRILRRAKRLRITFSSRFVGGAATKDRPATAKRTVSLRLRG